MLESTANARDTQLIFMSGWARGPKLSIVVSDFCGDRGAIHKSVAEKKPLRKREHVTTYDSQKVSDKPSWAKM